MTYELYPIHFWVLLDVASHIPVRHPLRHHGKWSGAIGNSKERDNIGMRQPFPHSDLLVKDLGKTENMIRRLTNHANVKRYLFDFVHVVTFVDTQGLYCHMPFAVNTFPNITETPRSNGVLAHRINPFFGDGVRSGDESSAATQLSKPLGNERIKGSVPQDLCRVSTYVLVLVLHYPTLSKTSKSVLLTPSVCASLGAYLRHLARYFGQSSGCS